MAYTDWHRGVRAGDGRVVRVSPEPSARRIAYDALRRIESHGAYANLVMRTALGSSALLGLRSALRHRPRVRHDPHASGVRRARRSLHRRATRRGNANAPSPRRLPVDVRPHPTARGRQRDGRARTQADAGVRQRRPAQALGRRTDDALAVGGGPAQLSRLAGGPIGRRAGPRRRDRGDGAHERAAAGHPTRRRIRAGPVVAVGGVGGRGDVGRAGARRVRRARRQVDGPRRRRGPRRRDRHPRDAARSRRRATSPASDSRRRWSWPTERRHRFAPAASTRC